MDGVGWFNGWKEMGGDLYLLCVLCCVSVIEFYFYLRFTFCFKDGVFFFDVVVVGD